MRRTAVSFLSFFLFLIAAGAGTQEGGAADPAAEAWARRGTREGTRQAIAEWEKAVGANPRDLRSLASLAHAYYWLGQVFEENDRDKAAAFDKGIEYGKRALELDGEDLEALYWTGDCLGARAGVSSVFTKLLYVTPAKAHQRKVLDRDPAFFHGGPHLFRAMFHVQGDGLAGGRFEKSYERFDKAIAIEPNYLRSYYLYAQWTLLADTRKSAEKRAADRARAKELLEKVLATPADALAEAAPENEVAKRQARALYEREFGAAP